MKSKLMRHLFRDKKRSERIYLIYTVVTIIANIMIVIGMLFFIVLLIRK